VGVKSAKRMIRIGRRAFKKEIISSLRIAEFIEGGYYGRN
jgi:hypothetical protein